MSWERVLEDGFEGAFEDWDKIAELTVPVGWMPVWVQGSEPGVNHRPECDRERDRVASGRSAAKMFTVHASHNGALTRRVKVLAGSLVRVVAMGANYKIKCGHGIRVGIDPLGGLDHESEDVVWSDWWSQYDKAWEPEHFVQLSAAARAEGDAVTVFLASESQYAGQVVAAYWDDVVVEQEKEGGEDPGPEPGEGDLAGAVRLLAAAVEGLAEKLGG